MSQFDFKEWLGAAADIPLMFANGFQIKSNIQKLKTVTNLQVVTQYAHESKCRTAGVIRIDKATGQFAATRRGKKTIFKKGTTPREIYMHLTGCSELPRNFFQPVDELRKVLSVESHVGEDIKMIYRTVGSSCMTKADNSNYWSPFDFYCQNPKRIECQVLVYKGVRIARRMAFRGTDGNMYISPRWYSSRDGAAFGAFYPLLSPGIPVRDLLTSCPSEWPLRGFNTAGGFPFLDGLAAIRYACGTVNLYPGSSNVSAGGRAVDDKLITTRAEDAISDIGYVYNGPLDSFGYPVARYAVNRYGKYDPYIKGATLNADTIRTLSA